jgi:CheY-like chemotaxis protein
MPVSDAYGLLERRSDHAGLAEIPVVAVTLSTSIVPSAERLGVRTVLQRPHDVNRLRAAIAQAIDRRAPDA